MSNQADSRHSSALRARLEQWLQEATNSLSIAEPVCVDANSLLSGARLRLEDASVLWAQSQYLSTAIAGQIETLKHIQDTVTRDITNNRKVFEVREEI